MIGDAGIVVVTGTDTGVGKTIVTAALAARGLAAGRRVAVVKPAQTGTASFGAGETSDIETVRRLLAPADVTYVVGGEYPDPLSPLAAAEESGRPPVYLGDMLALIADLAKQHDLVLVEGAGGVLVPMGASAWTIADLAVAMRAPTVVVARAGLGTINHTALTLEALARRGIAAAVVIGAWPAAPELVHERNLVDLPGQLIGRLPDGAHRLDASTFRAAAPAWFGPINR